MLNFIPTILKTTPHVNITIVRNFKRPMVRPLARFGLLPLQKTKTLKEILAEENWKDPEIYFKVDIGLPPVVKVRAKEMILKYEYSKTKREKQNLERASRTGTLDISTHEIRDTWLKENASKHIKMAADHYGIFDHLFQDAYFYPQVMVDIAYPQSNGLEAPVYRGNEVKPSEAQSQPTVKYESEPDDLWTLILTNPDGNLIDSSKECVHWFVGNIPGSDVAKGEVIFDYLRPFPPRGIGYQRLVFILYKQEKRIDYSKLKNTLPRLNLKDRTFETLEFYRERQDDLTPAGLAFFQSDWDKSVRNTYHHILDMEEPVFEYDHLPRPLKKEEWFPIRKGFNQYLDKYKDPRDVAKQYLLRKLKETEPFEAPKKPFPYPNIYKYDRKKTPTWLITEKKRSRMGLGYINLLKDDDDYDDPK